MLIADAVIKQAGKNDQSLTGSPDDKPSFTVDFSKQFTLHIEVESKLNLANKKVEITVPDGLTVVEYPIPERGGMAESVTPESIDELHSKNNYGGYHPTNGTITYSLKNTAEKNSFNIVLAPDTVLWNRTKEQSLTEKLTIRVYTDDADGQTYQTISATPKITGKYNDAADDNRAIQTGPRLSRIGVKTGVPTAANQPFALRQIWINPDKDYIDMPQFFKKLEITIALPYYTKNGSNIYAELDHITWDPAGQSTRPNMLDPENHKDAGDDYTYTETKNDTDHTVTLTWTNLYLEYGQDYFTPYFKWTSDCDVTTTDAVKWGSNSILNTGKTAPGCYEGKTPTTGAASAVGGTITWGKTAPGCYEGKTPTTGAASAVGGTITWQDNSTWYLYNGDCTTFSFTAQAGESMSVNGKANNQPIYNNYAGDSDIIYYLGQFHVVNQGGAASANKTVEFTYGHNDKIGVTAQKIPATTGNTVEVWYTTTTNSTEQKYSGPLTSSGGFVTFTANMANLVEGEYFTKIKANVGSYEKDYVGYVSSRDQDPTSGYATTFGKLLTADEATYSNFASMKMYDTGSGDSTAKSGNYTVKVTNTRGEIPLAMEQAYKEGTLERVPILSKTSATAGDTITFNGLLSSSAYPYSSNNVTTDQEVYIRLPEKITVTNLKLYQEVGRTADKVFLLDAVTETVTNPQRTEIPDTAYKFEAVTSAEAGYKLYKITFTNQDNPAKVGWFTDGLGQYQIGISFDMNIAKDADAMTLDMRDCVRFKSASLTSTANNGTLAQYQVVDNGARYSTFNVNAKGTKLSVVAARLGLTFTFGARITEKASKAEFDAAKYSNFENDKQKVYLKDADHVVDMLFTLKNETGREFSEEDAHAFYYFIPVPKNGDLWDSHMQDQPFEFDMSLTRAPELQGTSKDHILVTYATEIESTAAAGTDKHYSNTAQYETEERLLAGCTTDEEKAERWRKVKMIRIAAKPGIDSIPQNAELKVNMRLEPMFDENADLVGSEINFGPCGVSPYSVGNTPNQGHNPLPRIQVEFQTGVIAGKIFIDKNFNGTYDEGTDELYTGGVTVEANHSNGNQNCTEGDTAHKTTATDGTFSFTGRRADTYHVTVTNPGSTDANGENPLKFSLPESGGKFSLDAGKNSATANVVLDMNKNPNDIENAQNLTIGLQQPHTVTFSVPNGQGGTTTKVWQGDKLGDVIPTVTANKGYRFTGNWTVGDNTYTADQLKEVAISNDVTVKAEVKKLYSLTYDLNGGSGAAAPATTWHIQGEKVRPDYSDTQNLKKGDKTIFVGWSEEQIQNPLPEDAEKENIDKIISHDEYIMPAQDVTFYAVYAVDGNGNGNPDYNDNAVHVRYHGNNNVREDIICPHHHVAGATEKLSTSGTVSGKSLGHDKPASDASGEVTSHTFTFTDETTGNAHIFIGWSTSPILDTIIKTKADYDGLASSIVTKVTMEKAKVDGGNADDDGNTNVYAVWAADRNGNKTADYLEEYTLTYDGNAQQGGTVTSLPTDTDIHIPGDEVTLSSAAPTHDDVDGKKVVFVGWTETKTDSIFSRADTAPATVTEVTFGSANKTVYAAWGYDENGNGTADVLETYTLTYDLNGGNETAPAKVSGIAKNTEIALTADKNFTRNTNEVFVGWSVTKSDAALTAETKQEDLEKFLIAPGAKYRIQTEDVTLYAVWAADSNKNGMADYLEACATINAVKILEGRDWLESDSFEFKLEAVTNGAPMPENSSVVVKSGTAKSGEGVPFNFGEITYTKPGTYTYEVSEVAGENKGMVYDPHKAIVTIEVVNNNDFNKLKSINYDNGFKAPADAATFANHYKANMTYGGADRVDVAMTLNGRAMHKDEFAFKIDGNDDESRSKLSSLDTELSVTEDTAAGAKHVMQNKFQGLEFTQDDVGKTYTYTVKEDIPADNVDKIPGVTYDPAVYTVKITPKDNGDGTMHAETVVTDSSGKTINPSTPDGKSVYEVSFVNTYKADSFIFDTAAGFNLSKKLEGRDWLNGDSFEFTLAARDGAPMPATDKVTVNNTNLDEAGEKAAFGFGEITYTEPGVYTYEVRENDKENTIDGVEYDDQVAVITVTVTDKLNGTMEAKAEITSGKAIFTNKYATGGIEVNTDPADTAALFDKVLTGRDWTADDSFKFELTAVDGAPMPEGTEEGATSKTVTLGRANAKAGDHVAFGFGKIKFTDANMAGARLNGDGKPAKTFEYKVTEAKGSIAGVKYDEHAATLKVTVVDNLNGTMTATPAVTEGTFTNSYEARGTTFNTASVNLNKVLKGRDWTESDGFEFKLEAVTDGAPMPENSFVVVKSDTAKSGEGVPFDFGEITYDKAGEYKYKVTEVVPENKAPGVTYDTEPRIVTVKVTDNLDGTMTAARVDENGAQPADALVFTNVYKAGQSDEVPAGFSLAKVLTGRDWLESDSFEFKLTALNGAPVPKDDDGETLDTVTVSGKDAGASKKAGEKVAFNFGKITYTEPGTYTYEVSEAVPESDADRIPGMVYSGNKATVTVEVTDDTVKGKLVASATVANGTFTNAYKSELDYNALGGLRIVKKLEGRDISDKQFKFDVAADGADKADTLATGAATMDVRTGVATSTIAQALGDLVFTQADAGKTFNYTVTEQPGSDKGFTYDASKYEVSIGVSDDGRGVLTATTVIKKDGKEVGEYTYKTGDNPATGDDIPTVEFDNSFDAKGSVAIEATKTLKNRPLNAGEFTFQVVDKNGTVVATATNDENGKVDFGSIEYTNAQLAGMVRDGLASIERKDGNLLYIVDCTVREVTDELQGSGVTPVLSSQAVTVEATDDGTPDLSVKIQGNPAIKFTNAYADGIEAPMDLNVKSDIKAADPLKGLELPKMTKGMFQFTLSGAEAEDGTPAPMPEGVEGGTKTVGNDEAGNVDFGTVKYTVENVWPEPAVADDVNGEEGIDGQAASGDERSRTFTYTVIERTGGAAGISYDDSVKTIKVTVRDDGQGNLTVTRSDFDSITTFVNTYDVDSVTSIPEISVNKKIDGRDLNKGEFTFELLNKSNKVASTGTNDADGKVTFEAIKFSKPGTYEYTLHEAENKLGGVSYDSSFYKVTATVTQDVEAAQLDVAWTVRNLDDEAVENVVFSNAYKAEPTSIQFNGAKQLDGRDIVEGEFEFELVQDGKVIQTVKNAAADESGAAPVSFDAIEFTEPGEFDYEIREVKGSAEGVTYDDEVFTYHVVVTDNGKGNLEAEWTAGDNGAPVFVNAYEKPASPFDPVLPPDDGDDDGDKLSQTGDTSPIVPLTVVVVLAACVAAVAALRMRRK